MKMQDNFEHKGSRKKLVAKIKKKGIKNKSVLLAIEEVPRHIFLDEGLLDLAYLDQALPIGHDQTISQPYTVAFQTTLLDVHPNDKILEIGTGSGYQAAVLVNMNAQVYSIERNKFLFRKTKQLFLKLGYNSMLVYGDGYKGLPKFAPFDKIIITAAAPEIPKPLLKQLKVGGKLVVPVGGGDFQEMLLVYKVTSHKFEIKKYGKFSFVPMLRNKS